jgi:signal peptidase I
MYEQTKEQNAYSATSKVLSSISSFVFNTIEAVVIALALSIVFYLFIATPHEVVGRSMIPNFNNGEYLIGNKIVYKFSEPVRGDVIIFEYDETVDYIKRIVGLPGETISIQNGYIYINDKQLDEQPYLDPAILTRGGNFLQEGETVQIPDTSYFVCGDNRPNSSDSRDFGPIKREQIKGKAWLVYFPFGDFRLVRHPEIIVMEHL